VQNGAIYLRQPEILSYLEDVSREFDIESLIEFNTELLKAEWDNVKMSGN
jgi:cation diffusion facilitator CzcD-associated flavoprotein CzcO